MSFRVEGNRHASREQGERDLYQNNINIMECEIDQCLPVTELWITRSLDSH